MKLTLPNVNYEPSGLRYQDYRYFKYSTDKDHPFYNKRLAILPCCVTLSSPGSMATRGTPCRNLLGVNLLLKTAPEAAGASYQRAFTARDYSNCWSQLGCCSLFNVSIGPGMADWTLFQFMFFVLAIAGLDQCHGDMLRPGIRIASEAVVGYSWLETQLEVNIPNPRQGNRRCRSLGCFGVHGSNILLARPITVSH
jgi:hypothetical protein